MNGSWLPLVLGVFSLVAVADWVAVWRRWRVLEWVCKPLVMVVLVWLALALELGGGGVGGGVGGGAGAGAGAASARGWVVAALLFSLAGDVFLMLGSGERLFLGGLSSFFVAHVAYVVAFFVLGVSWGRVGVAAAVVAGVGVVVGGRVLRALGRSKLRGPVVAYMTVISVMVAIAVGTGRGWAVVGAALFYWSDATIAWNRFVRPFGAAKLVIIVTYHLAQLALVCSLALP